MKLAKIVFLYFLLINICRADGKWSVHGYSKGMLFAAKNSPMAVAKNQIPIIKATIFLGDNFVTMDNPIGEIKSSPNIMKQYPQINGHTEIIPVFTLAIQLT